jgi:dihydroorotate dehydrogenase electron transfer subunit
MAKIIEDLRITANETLNRDFFVLTLAANSGIPEMKPGQFAQIRVDGSRETFLRRPLSIHDVDYEKNSFKLLIQRAGKGTTVLSKLEVGDTLNLVYPLGNSFSLPEKGERVILIGGGCGIAPLLFLAKYLRSNGFKPDILLGFRNRERVIEFEEYQKTGNVYLTTEDGSVGEKGYVTSHPVLHQRTYNRVYCCGPESMMKAAAAYALENNMVCEVSLENLMACGFGVCLCCSVETVRGNLCTCTDGPVFNISDLKW